MNWLRRIFKKYSDKEKEYFFEEMGVDLEKPIQNKEHPESNARWMAEPYPYPEIRNWDEQFSYHVGPGTSVRKADLSLDEMAEKLFSKMYVMSVIVYCYYCGAGNTISNPTCVQCGAPPGKTGWKKEEIMT